MPKPAPPFSVHLTHPSQLLLLRGAVVAKNFARYATRPHINGQLAKGAKFVEAGIWLRAQWYPAPGETEWRQSVDREVIAVRKSVGVCDVSTLGKIDIQGRDAGTFLNRVYANGFAKLPVGKTRYGLMLREDGMVMDDGTTARLGKTHYLMTTTTANAVGRVSASGILPPVFMAGSGRSFNFSNGTICPICHCRTKFPPPTGKAD